MKILIAVIISLAFGCHSGLDSGAGSQERERSDFDQSSSSPYIASSVEAPKMYSLFTRNGDYPPSSELLNSFLKEKCEQFWVAKHSPFVECIRDAPTPEVNTPFPHEFRQLGLNLVGQSELNFEVARFAPNYDYGFSPHLIWSEIRQDAQPALFNFDAAIGLIEMGCSTGQITEAHPNIDFALSFDYLAPVSYNMQPDNHALATTSALTYLNPNGDREILEQANVYIGNTLSGGGLLGQNCPGSTSFGAMLDWFVSNNVRAINQSTYKIVLGEQDFYDAFMLDWYTRTYDWVVTSAAGQHAECGPRDPVLCRGLNTTCVGGYYDSDISTYGDINDDEFVRPSEEGCYFYHNPERNQESDREEPDVVAEVRADMHVYTTSRIAAEGTSIAAPATLANQLVGLEGMRGVHWTSLNEEGMALCRVSEMVRGLTRFHAGSHSVKPYKECATNSDCGNAGPCSQGFCQNIDGRNFSTHDLQLSSTFMGKVAGSSCAFPYECTAGLTCEMGVCAEDPGDEMIGWGGVSPLTLLEDETYICPEGDGSGPCMPTTDGSCKKPSMPRDDVTPQSLDQNFAPKRAPGKSTVASAGVYLGEIQLNAGEKMRGVLSWSSCPVLTAQQDAIPCETDEDCPLTHCMTGYGVCDSQRNISDTAIPDFDLYIWSPGMSDAIPISYSKHDVIESFQFTAPISETYHVWRFATEDDWDVCDESLSQYPGFGPQAGTWEFFVMGKL